MKKRVKIVGLSLLFLVAVFFLLNHQAKHIVISFIESTSQGKIKVEIGQVIIQPFASIMTVKDVSVLMHDHDSKNFKQFKTDRIFLDVTSLWDFFSGGALIIQKFECEGGYLTIFNNQDSAASSHSFDLTDILQRIKSDAIRFRIEDLVFRDFNLYLMKDSAHAATTIKHLYAHAENLYLSADSLMKKKPVVEFNLPRQVITMPNDLSFGFDSLSFSTTHNSLQVLKLELKSPPQDVHHTFHIQSDQVRVAHFSFESLYKEGGLVLDSIFFGKSTISIDWMIRENKRKENVNQQAIPSLPSIDIGSLLFKEIVSDIIIRNDSIQNTFNVEHASLSVDGFRHRPDSSHVIYAPQYNLFITRYATFLGNTKTQIKFDTIQIQKHSLSLLNFSFYAAGQVKPVIQTPRFELESVDWYELLVNRKLQAEEARVFNPTIITTLERHQGTSTTPVDRFKILHSLNEFLRVNVFSLKNATAVVHVPDIQMNVMLKGYNTTFNVMDLINSGSVNEGIDAISDFSFSHLRLTNPNYKVQVEQFKFGRQGYSIGHINYDHRSNMFITFEGLALGNIRWSESSKGFTLDGVGWKSFKAEVMETDGQKSPVKKSDGAKLPNIHVENIRGGYSDLFFQGNKLAVRTSFHHVNLERMSISDSLRFTGLDLKGELLLIQSGPREIKVGSYEFSDHGGIMSDIGFVSNSADSIDALVGRFSFSAYLPDFANQKFIINSLMLDQVKLKWNKHDGVQNLSMDANARLTANDLVYHNKNFSLGSLLLEAGPFDVINTAALQKKTVRLKSDRGGIKLDFGRIKTFARDSAVSINAKVNAIEFSEVNVETDKLLAWINSGSLNNLVIDSDRGKDVWKLMEDNYPTAAIHKMKATIETNGNLIRFDSLEYDPQSRSGSVRQFQFRPIKEKHQVLDESVYQTNYIDTRIPFVAFNRFNVKRFLEDTVIHLATIHVQSPTLEIGRDKTRPFFSAAIKPLPTNAFQKLKMGFKIDTLHVLDGRIAYTEKSNITGKEGFIHFSQMNALVRNVKNIELLEDDSLFIRATTRFMDSASVRLRVRESYRDTLAGFVLTSQVGPFHTSILNKAVVPMASVDFKSGYVDTLYMRAIGREYLALGSMKFLYKDLKVEFLDKNDTARHSIKNQLLKFAANTFVIRTNNTQRLGKVFFERDRHRAVFQYWVKMILSGVTTSVGAKSNKKQLKKYMKNLNQKKLPPIEDKFDLL